MGRSLDPTTPASSTGPNALVIHPRLSVSDFTRGDKKEWDVEMLDNIVHLDDITLITRLAIGLTYHRDSYC